MSVDSHFKTALIVEDEAALRRGVARLLERWADEVIEAGDVAQARAAIRRLPDLAVIDIGLPDGTGLDVVTAVRDAAPQCLVIAISGEASPTDAFQLAELGVLSYLAKPFSLDSFDTALRDAVAKRRRRAEAAADGQEESEVIRVAFARCFKDYVSEHGLSPREVDIVRLLLDGVDRARFPELLGITENTCKTTVRRLIRKCGADRLADIRGHILLSVQRQAG